MDLKEQLLKTGIDLFSRKSYHATGLREITKKAGVPIGSFHYHFKNKEEFALEVLDYFFNTELKSGSDILFDNTMNSKQKLLSIFKTMIHYHEAKQLQDTKLSGCVLGVLGQEMSGQSTAIANKVNAIYSKIIHAIKTLIDAGQKDQSLINNLDSTVLSAFIFDAYEGALIRRKIENSSAPMNNFIRMLDQL